jgi:hypothetical protein
VSGDKRVARIFGVIDARCLRVVVWFCAVHDDGCGGDFVGAVMTVEVLVTPLEPPFAGEVIFCSFSDGGKPLAISRGDWERVKAMFDAGPLGRRIVLESVGEQICISVEQ